MANSRSIAFTPEGLAQVRQRMAELPKPNNPEKKRWSQDDLAECASLGKKTVQRALKPESVDRDTIISIANALNLDPSTLVDPSDWNREPVGKSSISFKQWRQICEKVLKEKRQPNINELARSEEENHDVDDLFIPLGLVEKKQTRVKWDSIGFGSVEQGSVFYEPQPEEIVRRFDQANEFFETVIRGERSAQSRPIIIIGEPGAGKTTLLQKIATELPDELLPVWVSLADLQGCNLDQYLFGETKDWFGKTWWSQADKTLPSEAGEEFKELFKTGQVCLLLDGVDEMSVPAEQRGLSQLWVIYNQVKGWSDQVRVIMTCRVNVWEADPLFDKFEMYRNLQLEYPEQVEQYIDNFFSKPDLTVQSGEVLKQELRENDRVQDTVKNPLRLALLCHSFQCGGKLPDTQTGLYEMFLKSFYDIKKDQFYVERESLHHALGQLALEALDREQSNYRIDRSTAEKFLGYPEQEKPESLFHKALKLGLLNKIGYLAEDSSQECYAFIHATFQEYFASLSIEDPSCLLGNRLNMNASIIALSNLIILWTERETRNSQDNVIYNNFIDNLNEFRNFLKDKKMYFYSDQILVFLSQCLIKTPEHHQSRQILNTFINKLFPTNKGLALLIHENPLLSEFKQKILSNKSQLLKSILYEKLKSIDIIQHKLLMSEILLEIEPHNNYAKLLLENIIKSQADSFIDISVKIIAVSYYDINFEKGSKLAIECILDIVNNPNTSDDQMDKCIIFLLKYLNENELPKSILNDQKKSKFVQMYTSTLESFEDFRDNNNIIENHWNEVTQNEIDSDDYLLAFSKLVSIAFSGLDNIRVPEIFSELYLKTYSLQDYSLIERKRFVMTFSTIILCRYLDEVHKYSLDFEDILLYINHILFEVKDSKSIKLFISLKIQFLENIKFIKSKKATLTLIYIFSKAYRLGFEPKRELDNVIWLLANQVLFLLAKKVSDVELYKFWELSDPNNLKIELLTPIASTPLTQQLDRQFFNLQNQLTPTDTTYPLCLNLSNLQNLNDRAELCQELATLSYETIDPSFDTLEIPENVQNPAQLKTKLLHLRKYLKTKNPNLKNLALILHDRDPTPELLQILNVLQSSFSIAWITDRPHPYRSFLPTAENLPKLIQTWLTDLN